MHLLQIINVILAYGHSLLKVSDPFKNDRVSKTPWSKQSACAHSVKANSVAPPAQHPIERAALLGWRMRYQVIMTGA